ncbi:hypothetical protein SAMN02927937_02932 [Paenimyroides aquimaris]|uniref:Uncharacterized protein n=1 Tax=Paenimyroides marinum TaxID=1159016 RepID=A0A1H6N2Z3_9FLAO|nr:hypothetical protein [Paenimyroides aquimaris]SEI04475.1 hypothetical protein SAMN02927937_02932 [Paenimyroides aquimaris]
MIKKLFLFLVFIFSTSMYSQNMKEEILNDAAFKELAERSLKFYSSEIYLNYDKISKEYISKMPTEYFTDKEADFPEWIKHHLSKTKFKSVEEAIDLYNKSNSAFVKKREAEDNLNNLLFTLVDKYGRDNFKPVYDEYVLKKIFNSNKS